MTVRLGRGEDIYELLKVASLNGLLGESSSAVETLETGSASSPHGASGADIAIPDRSGVTGSASSPHSAGGADVWIPARWKETGSGASPHAGSGADIFTLSGIVSGSATAPHGASGADIYRPKNYLYPIIVEIVTLTNQGADIAETDIPNTTAAGLYRVSFYLHATAVNVAADDIIIKFYWFDGAGLSDKESTPIGLSLAVFGTNTAQDSITAYKTTGSISYSVTGGNYSTAKYALYIVVERL